MQDEGPLPLHYLRVVQGDGGNVLAIVSLDLWSPAAAVVVHKAYAHAKGERGAVSDFCKSTHFFNRKWQFIPVGPTLEMDMSALWAAAKKYGILDAFEDRNSWSKPNIDLSSLAVLANGARFRGATLPLATNRGGPIEGLLKEKRYGEAEAQMVADALAFHALFHRLLANAQTFLFQNNSQGGNK